MEGFDYIYFTERKKRREIVDLQKRKLISIIMTDGRRYLLKSLESKLSEATEELERLQTRRNRLFGNPKSGYMGTTSKKHPIKPLADFLFNLGINSPVGMKEGESNKTYVPSEVTSLLYWPVL